MAGEWAHDRGRDGVTAAKNWLNMTTRVASSWTHDDSPLAELLEFAWPCGDKAGFSFDLGGKFRGGEVDGQSFLAEVKNYQNESDLGTHYTAFLAKCYVSLRQHPKRCDNFLWISWSPFKARSWNMHRRVETVEAALLHLDHINRCFGHADREQAKQEIDSEVLVEVSRRIWLITMNDHESDLTLTREHFVKVIAAIEAEVGA